MFFGVVLGKLANSGDILIHRFPELKKIAANFTWLSIERIFVMLLSLFVGIWVARYLGPEKYGTLSYCLAIIGIFGALPRLGFDEILVRELLDNPNEQGSLLGTALITRLFSASLACLGVIAYALSKDSNLLSQTALLIFSSLLFRDALSIVEALFKSQIIEKHLVWARAAGSLVASILRLILIFLKADFVYFCLTFVVDAIIYSSLLGFQFRKAIEGHILLSFNRRRLASLFKLSWPLYVSSIAVVIYMKFDQVVLQYLLGAETVGHYAAAVRICEIFHFIPAAIASSVFPSLVQSNEAKKSLAFMTKYICFMAVIAYALSIPLALLSNPIAIGLYGEKFFDTDKILSIYALNFIPIFLGTARNQYLLSIGQTHISLLCTIIGMVANIALCFLLIPNYGAIGAALASFISLVVSDFFSSFLFSSLRPLALMQLRALLLVDAVKTVRGYFANVEHRT